MPPAAKTSVLRDRVKSASEPSTTKTLTPQRKHRKLLKDGSSEVWPESIEKIFVEGLKRYWESPWATYSRGRSRWRNQFLVDYLQKAGVDRTKKQVASHIQVLRNMWKGESEFHLVAGGEELLLESGHSAPVKVECDMNALLKLDYDKDSPISPISPSTPGMSSTEFVYEISPELSPMSPFGPSAQATTNAARRIDSSSPVASLPDSGRNIPLRAHSATSILQSGAHRLRMSPISGSSGTSSPVESSNDVGRSADGRTCSPCIPTSFAHSSLRRGEKEFDANRLCYLALWAEGMLPFTAPSDPFSVAPFQSPDPIMFRVRLHLPSMDDLRCPPTLHGFQGTVSLELPWQFSAQCITKVFVGGTCVIEEVGALQLVASQSTALNGSVQAFLPESPLSRSRWLDASVQTSITQQIVVDTVTLAFILYDLDRSDVANAPSATLHAIQRYRPQEGTISPLSQPTLPCSQYYMTYSPGLHISQIPRLTRRPEPTSLSCALIPNHNLTSLNTSLLF